MSGRLSAPVLHSLQGAACIVVILWAVKAVSHLLVPLLMALLLAYALVPLPRWLMGRLRIGKTSALLLTVVLLGTFNVVTAAALYNSGVRLMERLPTYQDRFMDLFEKVLTFSNAHGITIPSISAAKLSTSENLLKFARMLFQDAGTFVGDGLLISLLAWIFLITMAEQAGTKRSPLANKLDYYGADVQRYISISSETGIITALANLVVLVAVGVDFPVLWCALYFFLHFIPNVGYILALVPPALLALLMLGWKKALLVTGGLIVTQLLSDYGLTPILMKKEVHISFLEITLSLMFWGFLLGPAGAILGVPLTLALRRLIEQLSTAAQPDEHAAEITSAAYPAARPTALGAV